MERVKRSFVAAKRNSWSVIMTFVMVIALSFFQTSCGGGGGGGTTTTSSSDTSSSDTDGGSSGAATFSTSGRAMKGVVKNATVNVYVLNADGGKGESLGSTTTDASGNYSLSGIEESPTDCYLFEITGGAYLDEITGNEVVMQASDLLSTVACDLSGDVNVVAITPLTTMAASRAGALGTEGAPLKTSVVSSNAGIARQYGLSDIVGALPVEPTDSTDVQTGNLDQRNYGIVLAALAQSADGLGARAIDLSAALAEDVKNGVLDGLNGSEMISLNLIDESVTELGMATGTSGVQDSVDTFLASPDNKTYVADFQLASEPVEVGLNTAGRVYVATTQLPAWTSGRSGSVTLAATGGTPGYSWRLVSGSPPLGFSLSPEGVLSGTAAVLSPGTTMSISPPFTVEVSDSSDPQTSATVELRITIIGGRPAITIADCADATQNESYSCRIAAANGGSSPYYYTLETGGGFPPIGLILGADGWITGTPSATGTYSFGVCAVDLYGAQDCGDASITVVAPLRNYNLTVAKTGTGSGSVSSDLSWISCGLDCSEPYQEGTTVTLTATPASGSTFNGWSGACSGTGACVITMESDKSVTAQFDSIATTYDLTVTKTGTGTGSVSSDLSGISCGTDCTESYETGTTVTLTATPEADSIFTGWSGACSGAGSCIVSMDSDKSVTANFEASQELSCSGSYSLTTTGDGGCTYYNSGSLDMSLTVSGGSFSGSAYADGIQLKYIESCSVAWYTSSSGSVSGTVDASGSSYGGTVSFPIADTGGTLSASWTGTLSGNTLSGTFYGGGDTGSFSLTCQ